jgi:hypothetical protein
MNIQIKLPKPHDKQKQILDVYQNFKLTVLLCGRRFGKSELAKIITIVRSLKSQKVAYVTPTFLLANKFYNEILQLLPPEVIKSKNSSELSIELITGGSIRFFSGEALERFRGFSFHFIIIDEAAFIGNLSEAWQTIIEPTLLDYNGSSMWISTPNGREYFYSKYQDGQNGADGIKSFHFTSYDNPFLPVDFLDKKKKELPDWKFNQEYLAIAGESQTNAFGIDNIKACTSDTLSTEQTVVYGIDLAYTNGDWTAITGFDRNGHQTYEDHFQLPYPVIVEKIKNLPPNVNKIIDATGAGLPIYQQLSTLVQNLQPFVFTSSSKQQLMMEYITAVQQHKIKVSPKVANEMYTFQYTTKPNGTHTFNAMVGYHDDLICSSAMAYQKINQSLVYQDWDLIIV